MDFKISEDGATATVKMADAVATYSLAEVEVMIALFGTIRSQLRPAVPGEPANSTPSRPLQNVIVRHVSDEMTPLKNGALLVARSDQFGWFDYPMDAAFCQGLIDWFSANPQALCAPPGASLN